MEPTHFIDEDKAILRHSGACLNHIVSLSVSPLLVVCLPPSFQGTPQMCAMFAVVTSLKPQQAETRFLESACRLHNSPHRRTH